MARCALYLIGAYYEVGFLIFGGWSITETEDKRISVGSNMKRKGLLSTKKVSVQVIPQRSEYVVFQEKRVRALLSMRGSPAHNKFF